MIIWVKGKKQKSKKDDYLLAFQLFVIPGGGKVPQLVRRVDVSLSQPLPPGAHPYVAGELFKNGVKVAQGCSMMIGFNAPVFTEP